MKIYNRPLCNEDETPPYDGGEVILVLKQKDENVLRSLKTLSYDVSDTILHTLAIRHMHDAISGVTSRLRKHFDDIDSEYSDSKLDALDQYEVLRVLSDVNRICKSFTEDIVSYLNPHYDLYTRDITIRGDALICIVEVVRNE